MIDLTARSRRPARAIVAARRLEALHYAGAGDDPRNPPGRHREARKGGRIDQWSIWMNDRCRACSRWDGKDAWDVAIVKF
jgi:proteic killer suppression protein